HHGASFGEGGKLLVLGAAGDGSLAQQRLDLGDQFVPINGHDLSLLSLHREGSSGLVREAFILRIATSTWLSRPRRSSCWASSAIAALTIDLTSVTQVATTSVAGLPPFPSFGCATSAAPSAGLGFGIGF